MDESNPTPGEGDPDIAALLGFEPVPRKVEVEGGWTPELQREFIARLAAHGSANKACDEMGKNRTGLTKLYNNPLGKSFRAAWDGAVTLARQRKAAREAADYVAPGTRPPTIDHRVKAPSPRPSPAEGGEEDFDEPDPDEEQKWALIHNIGLKFMRKVAAEREARLAGRIVAADFYLRQITFLEITFDLTATAFGWDAGWALKKLRRGKHGIMQIANTELADWLDRSRRLWWAQEGEPERPKHPDVRFLEPHWSPEGGGYATNVDQHATGALTTPARGFSQEEWAAMSSNEQRAARQAQFDEDGEAQREYERRAHEEYQQSLSLDGRGQGEGDDE